jgi:hypothetical protein
MEFMLPLILFGMFLASLVQAGLARRAIRRAESWVPVKGEITRSEVVKTRSRHHGNRATYYEARIEYDYEFEGRQYHGDTICVGGTVHTSLSRHAKERCRRFPEGANAIVYVDPQEPSNACLERGNQAIVLFLLAIAAFTLVAGVFFWLRGS